MTRSIPNSPDLLKQSETNRMIKRIFVVAEILARARSNPECDCIALENCTENQGAVDLLYLQYDSNSETQ